ncbi:hypothetical protein BX666DRAFT_1881803 [Dichotomocladium elegans]|nr:hypothetical protein BX666DRAFT_1881803 [Dichotomocladium elegans]
MSDRRARLEALAQKRRNEDTSPSRGNKKTKLSAERSSASKPQVSKKPSASKKHASKDKFIVDSDEEEEEDEDEDEDEESEPVTSACARNMDNASHKKKLLQDYSEDEKPRKKSSSSANDRKKAKVPAKKRGSKKNSDDEDEGSSAEDKSDISDNELEGLDTSDIIPGGRRTRGKKIDYRQFGPDPEDD